MEGICYGLIARADRERIKEVGKIEIAMKCDKAIDLF